MLNITTEHPLGQSIIYYEPLEKDYTSDLLPHLESLTYHSGYYKDRKISRDQIWFHQSKRYINPEWPIFERWNPKEYTPNLLHIQTHITNHIKETLKTNFVPNSLLINRYATGLNIIPPHSDSEHIFGDNPTIAILSVGAVRTIRLTIIDPPQADSAPADSAPADSAPADSAPADTIDIKLENNSLLVMAGTTQKYYRHELLKDSTIKSPRYSLTMREHKL